MYTYTSDYDSSNVSIPTGVMISSELLESETKLTRKSKISVPTTADSMSSLCGVLFPCRVVIQDLLVSSSMNNSHAFENTIGASPDIIFTSSPEFFMIFLILAKGNEWGPDLPVMPPHIINLEYLPGCLIFFERSNFVLSSYRSYETYKVFHFM